MLRRIHPLIPFAGTVLSAVASLLFCLFSLLVIVFIVLATPEDVKDLDLRPGDITVVGIVYCLLTIMFGLLSLVMVQQFRRLREYDPNQQRPIT